MIFHSPSDETLPMSHALALFHSGDGPKSLICLNGADHLLVNQPADVLFVGDVLAKWLARCIDRYDR
jgi:putative redox protein